MTQSTPATTTFTTICPILSSYDIDKTEAFYRDKLNFVTDAKYPNYLIMSRDNLTLHFTLMTEGTPEDTMTQAYIYVDDVQSIYEECKAAGVVHPNGDIGNQPYGMREFALRDADYNAIFFGQTLGSTPTQVIPRQDDI